MLISYVFFEITFFNGKDAYLGSKIMVYYGNYDDLSYPHVGWVTAPQVLRRPRFSIGIDPDLHLNKNNNRFSLK